MKRHEFHHSLYLNAFDGRQGLHLHYVDDRPNEAENLQLILKHAQ